MGRGGCCQSHKEGMDLYLRLYKEVRARLNIRQCLPGEEEGRGGGIPGEGDSVSKGSEVRKSLVVWETARV